MGWQGFNTQHITLEAWPDSRLLPPQDLGNAKRTFPALGSVVDSGYDDHIICLSYSLPGIFGGLVKFELRVILCQNPWCCIHSRASLDGESLNEVSKSASPKRGKIPNGSSHQSRHIQQTSKIVWQIATDQMGFPKIMWNNGRTFLSDYLFGWWQHNIPVLPKSHMNWMIKTTLPRKKYHVLLHPRKLTRPVLVPFQPESSLRTIILKRIFIGHYIIRHHRSCFWFSWHLYHQRLSCSPFTSILLNQ